MGRSGQSVSDEVRRQWWLLKIKFGNVRIESVLFSWIENRVTYSKSSSVEFILRPNVSRPVCPGIGLPFGAHAQILSFPFFSDNCFVVLPVGRPL
jgi:hypothetical protein